MRREFSPKVRLAAWERAKGCCEMCGIRIVPGNGPQYDHRIPDGLGGEPTLENCVCTCIPCHSVKTAHEDVPRIAKAKRIERKAANATRRKAVIPGSKASPFRKRLNGEVERRNR